MAPVLKYKLTETCINTKIFNAYAHSNRARTLPESYNFHDGSKRSKYEERIQQIEHASFTPLTFSTTGGASVPTHKFIKQLALPTSEKTGERYSEVISYIRTRLSFVLIRSAILSLRGHRGQKTKHTDEISIQNFKTEIRC